VKAEEVTVKAGLSQGWLLGRGVEIESETEEEKQVLEQVWNTHGRLAMLTRKDDGMVQLVIAPTVEEGMKTLLTKRELEILRLITQGCLNKQIAYKLGTSLQTVKNQVSVIFTKLKVGNRAQAVVLAKELGLLQEE